MAHLQYIPGDPRLVDQLVYELKSKGIFDQFRKDCISDVDTKPAYQNLRQRVENSVSTFLARQCWQPDLNKNQLREKLRKHILDGNYLEQGVERIVDQVVNPKIASVFIPQVEDLVYNYLGISRKKTAETSNGPKVEDLLPNDLEAVSPGSVNNDDKEESMEVDKVNENNEQSDEEKPKIEPKDEPTENDKDKSEDSEASEMTMQDSNTIDKENIPFPQEIVVENIPPPENSPPKVEVEKIELPKDTSENIPLPEEMSVDIPLPDEIKDKEKEDFFKPINTDDDDSSSDSSLRRNMSPLTPIRNYNNENSYDAQQAFENDSTDAKNDDKKEPSSFRFTIEAKTSESSNDADKIEKKDTEANLSYQFSNQVNINHFNTPLYDDSSNSHMLQIDYESDANSKVNVEAKTEVEHNSGDSKKEKKPEDKKSSHKSSHRSRDSHKQSSSSRDKKSESKQSSSRDSSRHDKSKSSKDDKSKLNDKDKSKEKERSDKKDSKDSSRHKSSHKSSHRDSNKDSKSHRSSSSHRHSSKHDDKKSSSSSSQRDKEKSSEKDRNSKDKSKDSRSSSHRSDKDRKSSSSSNKNKSDDKEKDKKSKKETDDHYSLSGRGNPNRRSTDRDSNDGSSSSKGSNNPPSSKSSQTKTDSKRSSKLDTTSTSGDSTSPSDKENVAYEIGTQARDLLKFRPIIRIEKNLETPVSSPPRLPFVPEVILRKPKIAANFEEAKKIMKMRKFLEEEQRRMNQEAALLLEFQANVRPSLSQVYSSVPGPELEFACVNNIAGIEDNTEIIQNTREIIQESVPKAEKREEATKESTEKVKNTQNEEKVTENTAVTATKVEIKDDTKKRHTEFFEVTVETEELSENEEIQNNETMDDNKTGSEAKPKVDSGAKEELKYFGEHEKYDAELERAKFSAFFKTITQKELNNKMYLINCDTYSENVFREASKDFGEFEIVNYHRNGHLKINKPTTVKNLTTEVILPVESIDEEIKSPLDVFSPQKSECSFELSSDYNDKLEEMVNKTSRQEIMEIILGSTTDTEVPKIDYCSESKIDVAEERKRKVDDSYSINNNTCVLKLRRLSIEHITSTTTEPETPSDSGAVLNTRSKYLGRPARVGLPKPRRTNVQNSPSSDKSVENYEHNTPLNGKIKRQKVQRYDTSDLYKPKLHYLKRNNIT